MIEWILQNWDTIIMVSSSLIGAFATIATVTPNKSDDKVAQALLDAINVLGMNIGKAKNKE